MRERNEIEVVTDALDTKLLADYLFQFRAFDKLRDRKTAGRNYEPRL